jgi:ribosomal protein S18 acetylase RimI-like enzyme
MWERGAYIFSCAVGGGDDLWTLENIATLPLHRRKGLTTALIEKALEEGQQEGHDRVQVSTFIGNDPAIRAYERLGFELVAEQRNVAFESVAGSPGLCRLERAL